MKYLIVANWKLNPNSAKEAKKLFDGLKKAKHKNVDVVVCPPSIYLPLLKEITLGAQNVAVEEKGAFTGEVSAQMLKDAKVQYVIVGHSERRKYFGETDGMVNKKVKRVLETGLIPILCVGENEGDDAAVVVENQITAALEGITRDQMKRVVVAYEPVWAIGIGKNCMPDQAMATMLLIKKVVANLYNRDIADSLKILYGGSVNSSNSASYIKEAGMAGLLVGGASLKPEEFKAIVKSI